MTYFILMVRQTGMSKISGGSCITVDGDAAPAAPALDSNVRNLLRSQFDNF